MKSLSAIARIFDWLGHSLTMTNSNAMSFRDEGQSANRLRDNHPMKTPYRLRKLAWFSVLAFVLYTIWQFAALVVPEVGEKVRSLSFAYHQGEHTATLSSVLIDQTIVTLLIGFPAILATLMGLIPQNSTLQKFCFDFEQYTRIGKVWFFVIELFDAVRMISFVSISTFMAFTSLGLLTTLTCIGTTLALLCIPILIVVYLASYLIWAIAKANKNFGLGSLATGLTAGVFTFQLHNNLHTALIAGLVTGIASTSFSFIIAHYGDIRLSTGWVKRCDELFIQRPLDGGSVLVTKMFNSLRFMMPSRLIKDD